MSLRITHRGRTVHTVHTGPVGAPRSPGAGGPNTRARASDARLGRSAVSGRSAMRLTDRGARPARAPALRASGRAGEVHESPPAARNRRSARFRAPVPGPKGDERSTRPGGRGAQHHEGLFISGAPLSSAGNAEAEENAPRPARTAVGSTGTGSGRRNIPKVAISSGGKAGIRWPPISITTTGRLQRPGQEDRAAASARSVGRAARGGRRFAGAIQAARRDSRLFTSRPSTAPMSAPSASRSFGAHWRQVTPRLLHVRQGGQRGFRPAPQQPPPR